MEKEQKREIFIKYLADNRISLTRLSKEIGVTISTLSNYKTGRCEIPQLLIWAINNDVKLKNLQCKLCL